MKLQNKKEVITLLKGATFLASGGGGPFALAQTIADAYLKETFSLAIVDADTLGKNDWLVIAAGMADPNSGALLNAKDIVKPTLNAVSAIQEWLNIHKNSAEFKHYKPFTAFTCLMSIEVGAINVIIPVITALKRGISLIDGDPSGRSVPTIDLTTISVSRPVLPNMATTKEKTYKYAVLNVEDYTSLQKAYSTLVGAGVLGVDIGLALAPMNGKELRNNLVKGTMKDAFEIGGILEKQCLSTKKVERIIEYITKKSATPRGCKLICSGKVREIVTTSVDNTDLGHMTIDTDDQRVFTIVIQNENILGQFADETSYCLTAPDSICYISRHTDDVYDNVLISQKLARGEEVQLHILAIQASAVILNNAVLMSHWLNAYKTSGYYGCYNNRFWK